MVSENIVIDLRMLMASGIGTYLQNVIPRVVFLLSKKKFIILGDSEQLYQYDWIHSENIKVIDYHAPIYSISEQFQILQHIPRNTALFWSPHYNIPILYRGNLLVTIYDVFHLAMPKLVGGLHKKLYARTMFNAVRQKAKAIITISHFTKNELIRFTGEGFQEIYPIHLGVEESWFNVNKSNNPHGKPFLLYVGNIKPHKNLSVLIKAFESLVDKISHDLVIVGKKEGFITTDNTVLAMASKLGDRVHITGFVEHDILKQYIAHASAFIFPSLYEGFGLPPLEAMAANCPVIVSNTASLPEVCGDAVLYCNPNCSEEIANKILELLNNPMLRESLKQRGRERAKLFTWEKCAIETGAIIDRLL